MSLKVIPPRYNSEDGMPECDFCVDGRASPERVIEEVNATLKAKGILMQFVIQDSQSCDPRFDLHM